MNFKLLFEGTASKKDHFLFVFSGLAVFLIIIFLLTWLYNTPFTFRLVCISNLGNPNLNTRGWWLFTLNFIFGAVLLVPHCMYLYRHFLTPNKYLGRLWLILSFLALFGLIMVGIFNETMPPMHLIFAAFVFGGLGLGLFLSLLILSWKLYLKETWPNKPEFIILLCTLIIFLGIIINELLIYGIDVASDLNYTEWVAATLLLLWLIELFFIIPEKNMQ